MVTSAGETGPGGEGRFSDESIRQNDDGSFEMDLGTPTSGGRTADLTSTT
jgi:hypothetical protein